MSQFLTVKEAAKLTGKSPSSIRRVIYPIIENDKHPDRHQIQPSVDGARQLRLKGENFAWKISEELLRREVPVTSATEKGSERSQKTAGDDGALLDMLRAELQIKNQQITQQSELISKQMELISGLSERLREGNVLMGSLQQRLALPDSSDRGKASVVEARTNPEEGESMEKHNAKPTTKPAKKKRGPLRWIFG